MNNFKSSFMDTFEAVKLKLSGLVIQVSSSAIKITFFKVFLSDTFTCPILGPLVPLLWISGDVSSRFQSQSGFCPYLHCRGKCNVHSPGFTSGATHCQPIDRWYCGALTGFISFPRLLLAPVRLESAIIRL